MSPDNETHSSAQYLRLNDLTESSDRLLDRIHALINAQSQVATQAIENRVNLLHSLVIKSISQYQVEVNYCREILSHMQEIRLLSENISSLKIQSERLTCERDLAQERANSLDQRLTAALAKLGSRDRSNQSTAHDPVRQRFLQLRDQDYPYLVERILEFVSAISDAQQQRAKIQEMLTYHCLRYAYHEMSDMCILFHHETIDSTQRLITAHLADTIRSELQLADLPPQILEECTILVRATVNWLAEYFEAAKETPSRLLWARPGDLFNDNEHEVRGRFPSSPNSRIASTLFPGYLISPPLRLQDKITVTTNNSTLAKSIL